MKASNPKSGSENINTVSVEPFDHHLSGNQQRARGKERGLNEFAS
jgi:hypothetical protein